MADSRLAGGERAPVGGYERAICIKGERALTPSSSSSQLEGRAGAAGAKLPTSD